MQHPPNIIERYATNFTLSYENAKTRNWEWTAESKAAWMPAGGDWQTFCTKWYGATASLSTLPEFPSLSLKPLPDLDTTISSSILVRESYVTMFDTVWAKAITSLGRNGVVITGQPGIGKTLFLYYLLVRLLQREQVVLFTKDSKMLYLFYHNEVYAASMIDVISASLPKPISNSSNVFIWSLLDIRRPEEPEQFLVNYPCLPVQTAPLNPIRYKIWSKEQTPLHTGLPLWTRDELAQGLRRRHMYPLLRDALGKVYSSSSPNLSDPLNVYSGARALLEEHYSEQGSVQPSPEDALDYLLDAAIEHFGYSARDVFEAVFNYPATTQRHKQAFSITYADLYAAVFALSKGESPDNWVSNQILTLSPVDQGPLLGVLWEVDFKSSWVAKSVIQKLGEAEDDEIRRQIRIFRGIRGAGALVGWILEPLAHRYITNPTNKFLLFNMNSNGADPPHFTLARNSPVPDHERFIKVEREIVRLQSITGLPSCLNNNSYYVPNDPNFPLFDAFIIEFDHAKKSAILWVLQMTMSRKPGGSAKGYQKICEIIAILKDELGEEPPPKKSKMAAGQTAALVQVRYLLVVPKDEVPQSQTRNLQWDFPTGWNQDCQTNDHRGKVYCLELDLTI